MMVATNLKDLLRLGRMSVMKSRRKSREPRALDIYAIRHAEWREANENQLHQAERNLDLNARAANALERLADVIEVRSR